MAPTSSLIPVETENEKATSGPSFPEDGLEANDPTNTNEPITTDFLGLDIK